MITKVSEHRWEVSFWIEQQDKLFSIHLTEEAAVVVEKKELQYMRLEDDFVGEVADMAHDKYVIDSHRQGDYLDPSNIYGVVDFTKEQVAKAMGRKMQGVEKLTPLEVVSLLLEL